MSPGGSIFFVARQILKVFETFSIFFSSLYITWQVYPIKIDRPEGFTRSGMTYIRTFGTFWPQKQEVGKLVKLIYTQFV